MVCWCWLQSVAVTWYVHKNKVPLFHGIRNSRIQNDIYGIQQGARTRRGWGWGRVRWDDQSIETLLKPAKPASWVRVWCGYGNLDPYLYPYIPLSVICAGFKTLADHYKNYIEINLADMRQYWIISQHQLPRILEWLIYYHKCGIKRSAADIWPAQREIMSREDQY